MANPSHLPKPPAKDKKAGLSLGATVGIAIGVALLVILSAIGAWIVVRRRRRNWGKKRKEQVGPDPEGDTPDQEISKKIEAERPTEMVSATSKEIEVHKLEGGTAVEIGDGIKKETRAELASSDIVGDEKARPISELYTEGNAHEMPAVAQQPVEIGEGKTFIAELDGTSAPPKKEESVLQQKEGDELSPKPLDINKASK
jgi:hypothetical protein